MALIFSQTLLFVVNLHFILDCGPNDVGTRFSICDSNGFKTLFFFFKPPAFCTSSQGKI